ncbi:MAG: hypothetical protein M3Z24_11225 [Chloroflexota bacterium]|nr:hypothetical protein [Chloroflexota bacterium]
MNTLLKGLYSGLMAGAIVAVLYFIDYGPGNGLYGVARWFAFDTKDSGRLIGFILLIVLGVLFGLIFGVLQGKREVTIGRALATGLGLGVAWWVIFAFLVALAVGHMSLATFNFGSVLYPFMLCLVYGLLLGTIYFQSTVTKPHGV